MAATGPPYPVNWEGVPISPEYLAATKQPMVVSIIIIFPILAFIVVALRMYTRCHIVRNPSWDDWAIVGALVFTIATSVCQGFQVLNGMGRHKEALTLDNAINSLKALFASIMMYNFGLTLTKLSIVIQYLRIATDKPIRRACWALIWFTLGNCLQTLVTGIFTCYPIPKFWDDDRIEGGCVNKAGLWYANAGINITQDIWLIVLPVFILRKLMLPRREKIVLILILGLGGFASLASVFRLHALYKVNISKDITWENPGTATWSAMELNIGIVCASLPTLRALFAMYFPRVFSSSTLAARASRQAAYNSNRSNRKTWKLSDTESRASHINGTIVIKTEVDIERNSFGGGIEDSNSETCLEMPERVVVKHG